MRCLIIGTSNSVQKAGYRPFLEALCPEMAFERFAIGATPSVLAPYALSLRPADDCDCVIIDTLVNDSNHIASGSASEAWCNRVLHEAVEHLQASGKRVVLLLMPQTLNADVARRLRVDRLRYGRSRGVEVVDGYDVVDAMQAQHGLDDDQIYKDQSHAGALAALIIAQRLARTLRTIAAEIRPAVPEKPAERPPYPYAFRPFQGSEGRRIERATSLLSKSYVRLAEGESEALEFAEPVALVGVSLNGAATSCFLSVESDQGRLVKDLRTMPDMPDGSGPQARQRQMQHQLVAFAEPLFGRRFVFSPVSDASGHAVEVERRARSSGSSGQAELEGAVVRAIEPGGIAPAPEYGEDDAATPATGEVPALSSEEACLARLASLMPSQARVERVASTFRRKVLIQQPPLWKRRAPQAAIALASVGVALGEVKATRKMLRAVLDENPGAKAVEESLKKLRKLNGSE